MEQRTVAGPIRVLSVGESCGIRSTDEPYADRVVDDEPYADRLADGDIQVLADVVESPEEAHRALRDGAFDCVVVASDLPGGTGVEFIEDVRESRPNIPCFLAVPTIDETEVDEALSAGATDVVPTGTNGERRRLATRRITNSAMATRAVEEAERNRRRLDRFVSGISHDLRSPLNVAQGRLALEREERESEHVDVAGDAIDRSIELLEDLVTLAQQGERPAELETVDLAGIAERCWTTVETGDARLSVETDRRIRAHPSRLRQLLSNLFTNAVTHGGDDVTVTVGDVSPVFTATRADDSLGAGFYVADDGSGIPEADRDRVFEVGYTTEDDGTGFGLNIVHEIAVAHGWDLTVTESRDGGTRFDITGVDVDET